MFKPVLKPKESEGHVLAYQPRTFHQEITQEAVTFLQQQKSSDVIEFKINEQLAEATGMGELERKNFNDIVEKKVLEKLQEVQEKSYAEAHALGMKDGHDQAFREASQQIQKATQDLETIINSIKNFKKQLFVENEAHLIETVFHLAKALALREVKQDPKVISDVLQKALENAQAEEELTVRMNPHDLAFLEKVKENGGNITERIHRLKLEPSESVSAGGCIVETNYGVIDATIETRIEKLQEVLESKLPKVHENEG